MTELIALMYFKLYIRVLILADIHDHPYNI